MTTNAEKLTLVEDAINRRYSGGMVNEWREGPWVCEETQRLVDAGIFSLPDGKPQLGGTHIPLKVLLAMRESLNKSA